jgi:hypothetical protein
MRMNCVFGKFVTTWTVATSVMLVLFAISARAQAGSAPYTFAVASGFLCEGSDSGTCPAVAESPTGGRYEISGAGTFDSRKKSANAAGTFTHKSTNGNVLETGVWIATDLISFQSYGIAPGALIQKGPALGRLPFGPKRLPIGLRPMPMGGLAALRISFLSTTGATKTATLELNCALGDVPRERSIEGIRLSFDRSAAGFTEEAGARVLFLSMRTQVNGAVEVTHHARTPKSAAASPE